MVEAFLAYFCKIAQWSMLAIITRSLVQYFQLTHDGMTRGASHKPTDIF